MAHAFSCWNEGFFLPKKRVGLGLFLCILHYSTRQLGGWGHTIHMRKAIKTDSNIQNTTQITTTTRFWNMKYAIKLPKRQIGVLINRRRKVNSCLLGTDKCASFIMSSITEDCFYYTWFVSVNELGDSKDHSEDYRNNKWARRVMDCTTSVDSNGSCSLKALKALVDICLKQSNFPMTEN